MEKICIRRNVTYAMHSRMKHVQYWIHILDSLKSKFKIRLKTYNEEFFLIDSLITIGVEHVESNSKSLFRFYCTNKSVKTATLLFCRKNLRYSLRCKVEINILYMIEAHWYRVFEKTSSILYRKLGLILR